MPFHSVWSALAALASLAAPRGEAPAGVAIVPLPAKVTPGSGSFVLTRATRIQAPAALAGVAARFRADLQRATGLPPPPAGGGAGAPIVPAPRLRPRTLGGAGARRART